MPLWEARYRTGASRSRCYSDRGEWPARDSVACIITRRIRTPGRCPPCTAITGARADVNAPDTDKNTPLHSACSDGKLDIAQLLLNHGAAASAENNLGETPLHVMSQGKLVSIDGVRVAQLLVGPTGASSTDVEARPIRPSDMKDEGCVFLSTFTPSCCCCTRRAMCPIAGRGVYSTVRQLLRGSLSCYMRFPDVMASLDRLAPHVPSIFVSCYEGDVKNCVLCYVALLRLRLSSGAPLSLISFPVLSATSLQKEVCRWLFLA